MNREITNKNLHLLLPGKISLFTKIYAEKKESTPLEALRTFYRSNTYKKLEQENTKLWHYGPVALYEELEEELYPSLEEYSPDIKSLPPKKTI